MGTKKSLSTSSPPKRLEKVKSLRKEITRLGAELRSTHRGLVSVRAELDQHKHRQAKQYIEISKILDDLRRDLDSIDSRCQRLEANAGRRAIEEVDRKSLAREAEVKFAAAVSTSPGSEKDAPTEVDDLPGYDEQPGIRNRMRIATLERRVESVIRAQREHQEWEAQTNNDIRRIESRTSGLEGDIYNAQKSLVPPEGCEVVVRRTS